MAYEIVRWGLAKIDPLDKLITREEWVDRMWDKAIAEAKSPKQADQISKDRDTFTSEAIDKWQVKKKFREDRRRFLDSLSGEELLMELNRVRESAREIREEDPGQWRRVIGTLGGLVGAEIRRVRRERSGLFEQFPELEGALRKEEEE